MTHFREGTMTGATFKAYRERLGLSQVNLTEHLGVSRRSVARYEAGEPIPLVVELAMQQLVMRRSLRPEKAPSSPAGGPIASEASG